MPRKIYRRKKVGKKYYRSKKKRYARRNYMGQGGKRFFKLRYTETISSSVAGVIDTYLTSNPTSYQDWSSISSLFDNYRTCAIKLKFIPQLPNNVSSSTSYAPLYIVGDPDSSTNPVTSVNEAIQYENMRVKNMYRPWKYYYKFPKVMATGSNVVINRGYQDCASPISIGVVGLYGTNFSLSTTYGTLVSTIYLVARNRR